MNDRPPVINIDVPKQPRPVINIDVPRQMPPIVNVNTEPPVINMAPHVCPKSWTFEVTERDKQGRIYIVVATPKY